jgi:DNA-binding NtrC family response regulator
MNDPVITVRNHQLDSGGPARNYLLVLRGERFEAHELPRRGSVLIGRADTCDVQIDHPSISRRHAAIHLGPPMAIEDLGSANGTQVGSTTLAKNVPAPLSFNENIALGTVTVILQQRTAPLHRFRLRSHDYFEERLTEECVRAEATGGTLVVLRVQCREAPNPSAVREVLADVLRRCDIAADYGPREIEILLVDAEEQDIEPNREVIVNALGARGIEAQVGAALYGRDGLAADALLAAAALGSHAAVPLVLEDAAMKHLYTLAERVAAGTISVLILGETGVGKEVLAEAVHRSSPRRDAPYLRLNCAALTDSLFESELFGYKKGAFTGAVADKPGLLETADGGTVFLDEVGELSPAAQVKLLRVLEDKKVLRVGALEARDVDVRFVAATNRDLENDPGFRTDLFYRIAGVTLAIPPLRSRPTEIPLLAEAFTARAAADLGLARTPPISSEAMALLTGYSWPGNIRELRNVMERAVLLCTSDSITPAHLPVDKITTSYTEPPRPAPSGNDERSKILGALEQTGGNQTEAAKILGISRRTLAKRMETHRIPRPRKSRRKSASGN